MSSTWQPPWASSQGADFKLPSVLNSGFSARLKPITYLSFNVLLIWLLQYINNNNNFFKFLNGPQIIHYMFVFYENQRESPRLVVLCPGQQHMEVRDLPPLTKTDPAARLPQCTGVMQSWESLKPELEWNRDEKTCIQRVYCLPQILKGVKDFKHSISAETSSANSCYPLNALCNSCLTRGMSLETAN